MTALAVFVESNTSGTGQLFVRRARARGLTPLLVSDAPERYPFVRDDQVDTIVADTSRAGAVVDACRALAASIAAVTTSSDYYVDVAAEVARALSLPGADPGALRACRDKEAQHATLVRTGVGVPATLAAATADEVAAAARALGGPVVVKPVMGSGSFGVRLCATADEAQAHAAPLFARTRNERGQPVPPRVLVSRYLDGEELSVEILDGRVLGITRKYLGPLPRFLEVGHDFPAPLAPDRAARIERTALAALSALGLWHGAAHVEIRDSGGAASVLEVNPRLAGGFIPELIRLATGFDPIDGLLAAAAGAPVAPPPRAHRGAAIRFLVPPRDGTIDGADGLEAARAIPGVVEATLYADACRPVTLRGDFRDRLGHVIATGDSWPAVHAALDRATAAVRWSYRDV